jgi:two-component system, chemotaxis family, CheB/CheR fusion protein
MTHQTTPPEFQRQLRSLFATLRTLTRGTLEGRDSTEDYAAHLEGRIGALARAHEMVMRAPPEGTDLQELVCGELLSQAVPQQQFMVEGPEIRINRESAAPLALAFHELTMNAITHGAFVNGTGKTDVTWRCMQKDAADWLQLDWHEHELTLHEDDTPYKGFGCELIERMLPYELGAMTTFRLTRDGARVQFLIPAATTNPVWRPAKNE